MTKDEAQHSRWTFYEAVNGWEGSENPFGILLAHRDQCYFGSSVICLDSRLLAIYALATPAQEKHRGKVHLSHRCLALAALEWLPSASAAAVLRSDESQANCCEYAALSRSSLCPIQAFFYSIQANYG
jgi:hypothetical protein